MNETLIKWWHVALAGFVAGCIGALANLLIKLLFSI